MDFWRTEERTTQALGEGDDAVVAWRWTCGVAARRSCALLYSNAACLPLHRGMAPGARGTTARMPASHIPARNLPALNNCL